MILYQGKHAHAHLVGGTTEEGAGAARAEYETLRDDGHKNTTRVGVVAADGKSELHSEQEQSDYVSINVFASFVHSLSDLVVMVGVLIAAIVIILRVYLKMAGLLNGFRDLFINEFLYAVNLCFNSYDKKFLFRSAARLEDRGPDRDHPVRLTHVRLVSPSCGRRATCNNGGATAMDTLRCRQGTPGFA